MSIVTAWIPSVWITSSACSRLSGEDVRYGIRTPITFSLPSASTARNPVSDESTPPDSPTIPLVNPRRRTTSSFKKLTSHRRAKSASICSGSPSSTPLHHVDLGSRERGAGSSTVGGWIKLHHAPLALPAPCSPLPALQAFDEMRQIHLEVRQ